MSATLEVMSHRSRSAPAEVGHRPPADRRVAGVLRKVRINAGLTQRELGEKVGRRQNWVWNCENGRRRLNVAEFVMWCRACELDPMNGFDKVLAVLGRNQK